MVAVVVLEELDSARPDEQCFWHCDFCFESSIDDCAGMEVRPFYGVRDPSDGLTYCVCVECVPEFLDPKEEASERGGRP